MWPFKHISATSLLSAMQPFDQQMSLSHPSDVSFDSFEKKAIKARLSHIRDQGEARASFVRYRVDLKWIPVSIF